MLGNRMIDRLWGGLKQRDQNLSRGKDELHLAVAAPLLETAMAVDERFDERELRMRPVGREFLKKSDAP